MPLQKAYVCASIRNITADVFHRFYPHMFVFVDKGIFTSGMMLSYTYVSPTHNTATARTSSPRIRSFPRPIFISVFLGRKQKSYTECFGGRQYFD